MLKHTKRINEKPSSKLVNTQLTEKYVFYFQLILPCSKLRLLPDNITVSAISGKSVHRFQHMMQNKTFAEELRCRNTAVQGKNSYDVQWKNNLAINYFFTMQNCCRLQLLNSTTNEIKSG